MDLQPVIDRAFESVLFETFDTGPLKPRTEGRRLFVPPELLRKAAEEGFRELSFFFRETHFGLLADRLGDSELSKNDRTVINILLKNAVTASKGELALCQDTGTAVVYAWKDESVYTGGRDREALEAGIAAAYKNNFLRASQIAPASFFDEFNTGDNLPAQIHIEASPDKNGGKRPAYCFLFSAKGGGSSNKTSFFSMTKALLEEKNFGAFLEEKISSLGTAACPPYRLAVVVGGSSPEFNLEVQKLAAAEALDGAPYFEEGEMPKDARSFSWIRRDRYWENRAMEIGKRTMLGAQFGGPSLLLDARVIRLPRHAASCPVSIGVSCAAHRNIFAYIDREGLRLEKLVHNPAVLLRDWGIALPGQENASAGVDLDRPVREICRELSALKAGDKVLLRGKILMARDAAHFRWHTLLEEGKSLPDYLFRHPVYYAGPSAAPPGKISGSLGPTTAGRMDPYAEEFMSLGASLITLAKGSRSPRWREACKKYGGFYLGTAGGAAALLAEENVTGNELIDYPDLGMEAVRLITVKDLPAFIIIDDKGGDLYSLRQ
jgi:fumarate hydratase class I